MLRMVLLTHISVAYVGEYQGLADNAAKNKLKLN
jgi:hypothetical protein